MPKTIILLFGEMGAGKSYWGEALAKKIPNSMFIEGDQFVPLGMAQRVHRMLPPKREHIDEIVGQLQAAPLFYNKDVIILSQALYKDLDRWRLIDFWQIYGHTVYPVWVKVPFWQNLKQLWRRERGGLKWVLYWLMSKPWFEKPSHGYQHPLTFFGVRDA